MLNANLIDTAYVAYIGRHATPSEIADAVPLSWPKLQFALASRPEFFDGPTWRTYGPDYEVVSRGIGVPRFVAVIGSVLNLSDAVFVPLCRMVKEIQERPGA